MMMLFPELMNSFKSLSKLVACCEPLVVLRQERINEGQDPYDPYQYIRVSRFVGVLALDCPGAAVHPSRDHKTGRALPESL